MQRVAGDRGVAARNRAGDRIRESHGSSSKACRSLDAADVIVERRERAGLVVECDGPLTVALDPS